LTSLNLDQDPTVSKRRGKAEHLYLQIFFLTNSFTNFKALLWSDHNKESDLYTEKS